MGRSKQEEEEGEQTRFQCLALVRSLVAAGLTTLAVVVVVMVIIVLHRPEKIILATSVQTRDQWWDYYSVAKPTVGKPAQNVRVMSHDRDDDNTEHVEPEDPGMTQVSSSSLSSVPAKLVGILVTVSAYNPSGRGEVNCTVNSIGISDMPTGFFLAHLNRSSDFVVPPQTWYRHRSPVNITDNTTLQYLYNHYADDFTFQVMMRVDITIKSINVTYYCWPVHVFVFYDAPADTPDSEAHCKTINEMNSSASASPAPAPAP